MFDPTNYLNPSAYGQFNDLESAFWDFALQGQNDNILTSEGMKNFHNWMQQLASTSYQNWYNSEPERMKRMREAGINPYLAAQGIAGASGSNGVAASPAQAQSKVPELLGGAGSALSAMGSGFGSVVNGISTAMKLRSEIDKIDSETALNFEQLGFTKFQSKAMELRLKYMDEKEQIAVWQALADFDKTKAEYSNLVATHSNLLAQYDEIIARKDLLIAEEGEVKAREILNEAMTNKANVEAAWITQQNEFFEKHGYRAGDPIFEGFRDKMVSDGTFDLDAYGNIISSYQGKVTSAVEGAKASASWDYRPSNVVEAASWAASQIGNALRDVILNSNGVTSWSELKSKINANSAAKKEFEEAFKDAKENLYENYLAKKRYYRNIRRGGNTAEVARAKNAMDNAKNEYDTFTKDKFGEQLSIDMFKGVQ
jgi:cell fate (sporulation/competence/biofilm development) regulator YlbF (YheA/YmcA/DUF963 family)